MSNKIHYNIDESDFIVETENFILFFSSELYVIKFLEKYKENRIDLTYKLTSRYNIEFFSNDYFDFILYSNIEKRGFKIQCKNTGVIYKCLKEVKLVGTITKVIN